MDEFDILSLQNIPTEYFEFAKLMCDAQLLAALACAQMRPSFCNPHYFNMDEHLTQAIYWEARLRQEEQEEFESELDD